MSNISLRYSWYLCDKSLKEALDMPEKCLIYFWDNALETPNIYLRYAWDKLEIYPRSNGYTTEIYLWYTFDILEISLIYAWHLHTNISVICLKYTQNKPEIYLWYTWDIPEIYLVYIWDLPEIYLRYINPFINL